MMDYNLKKSLEQGKYKSAILVTKADKYIPGQLYWCGYWHQAYKVLESHYKTVQGKGSCRKRILRNRRSGRNDGEKRRRRKAKTDS